MKYEDTAGWRCVSVPNFPAEVGSVALTDQKVSQVVGIARALTDAQGRGRVPRVDSESQRDGRLLSERSSRNGDDKQEDGELLHGRSLRMGCFASLESLSTPRHRCVESDSQFL